MKLPIWTGTLTRTDRSRIISSLDYLEKELLFRTEYEREVDWKVYQTRRSKRLEIERWVESLINATLDICKMLPAVGSEEVPETSREILFKIGSFIFDTETKAEAFSELAKIRNTLAHRYLGDCAKKGGRPPPNPDRYLPWNMTAQEREPLATPVPTQRRGA